MPFSSFVLQGLAGHQHEAELTDLLSLPGMMTFLAGVAYVKHSGVSVLANSLSNAGSRASFFVGIRNDITSYQGIRSLLECGVNVWAVDTATRRRVYHPKLYLSQSAKSALAVVGSANLTAGGLGMNIETSARLSFDLARNQDQKAVSAVTQVFDDLPKKHPHHVFASRTNRMQSDSWSRGVSWMSGSRSPTILQVRRSWNGKMD